MVKCFYLKITSSSLVEIATLKITALRQKTLNTYYFNYIKIKTLALLVTELYYNLTIYYDMIIII